MDDEVIVQTEYITQLGINIFPKLLWTEHIKLLAKRASQKLGFLFRSRKYFNSRQLLLLYKTQVRPHLEYCCHIWGGASKTSLSLLDKIQKKAVRLINCQDLTKALQPLEHRRRVACLAIYYKYFFGKCSDEINDLMLPAVKVSRPTRSSAKFHPFCVDVPFCKTQSHGSSFLIRVSKLWNKLPLAVFTLEQDYNLNLFKKKINRLDLCSIPICT